MSDFSMFDFNNLKQQSGADPFAEQSGYKPDERFYTLPKDEKGNGQALICFLPDPESRMIQQVYKINVNNTVNGKRRFVCEYSPRTANGADPFHEKWQELYNEDPDKAHQFARQTRYIVNIKVIKDPKKPENEGKIFLYELSKRLYDKIKQAVDPSPEDLEMGAVRKEVFNPFSGWIFKLVARKPSKAEGGNGITSYDNSEFILKEGFSPYKSKEEAINDIKTNGHKLSWFLDVNNYLSYDELKKKLDYVLGVSSAKTVEVKENTAKVEPEVVPAQSAQTPAAPAQPAQSAQPQKTSDSLDVDNLIDGLIN